MYYYVELQSKRLFLWSRAVRGFRPYDFPTLPAKDYFVIRSLTFAVIIALALSPTGVSAADNTESGKKSAESKTAPKEKKICVREAATGSIMAKRVCYTQAQIEANRAVASSQIDEIQRRELSSSANK